jgi:hypothetical protein
VIVNEFPTGGGDLRAVLAGTDPRKSGFHIMRILPLPVRGDLADGGADPPTLAAANLSRQAGLLAALLERVSNYVPLT